MQRTTERWLAELRDDSLSGEDARRELRAILVAGLGRALGGRAVEQIEDFAQDSIVRVLASLDGFRGDSRFTTWATAIAMRVAWSELRHARWKDVSVDELVEGGGEHAAGDARTDEPDTAKALDRGRVMAALERAIAETLTERQRTVIVAELRGMPQEELATRLHTNRNALYKVSHDARRALLRALEAGGFDAAHVRWAFSETGEGSLS